jgi:FkbM family methyltransferase
MFKLRRFSKSAASPSAAEFAAVVARLERLEQSSDAMRQLVRHEGTVDLVVDGPLVVFMFRDDLLYKLHPDAQKRAVLGEPATVFMRRRDVTARPALEGTPAGRCVRHMLRLFQDVALFDIGCHCGATALHLAHFVKEQGRSIPVYAFDPGDSGRLAPYNFAVNAAVGKVEFFPLAVSEVSGGTLLYGEIGNSENNRIGNPLADDVTLSRPALVTTIDDFLATRGGLRPAFLKSDTQGFDPEVVAGATRLIASQPVTIKTEFTPHAMRPRMPPETFLERLCWDFVVIDERAVQAGPIDPGALSEFVAKVDASPDTWTDLICVSKNLPDRESLVREVCGSGTA